DGPVPGYVTIIVDAEVDPGVTVPRHTHPGIESAYVVEGSLELPIEGQPTRTYNPGDSYQVPTGTPHAGGKPSDKKIRFTATYVVEKDKPLVLTDELDSWRDKAIEHKTAIFRQINKDKVTVHHDALEFPDGRIALLTTLCEGQQATVLQLPAEP